MKSPPAFEKDPVFLNKALPVKNVQWKKPVATI